MKKLWEKNNDVNEQMIAFTTGKDPELDLKLAEWDIIGSLAHVEMLENTGLLESGEKDDLAEELKKLYRKARQGKMVIEAGVEDIHSQIEFALTSILGEAGKKVHTARSRNDQIALDIRLFSREGILQLREKVYALAEIFLELSDRYKDVLMPGYTHFQVAMPSSFGLWFASFAEGLADDLELLNSAYHIVNQNPLGTAAGYGSSLPINREITTKLLGFEGLVYNPVYAQTGRGKSEKIVAIALSSVAATLSLFAQDSVLYMSQNFNFLTLPDEFTTGSSIMPHKKNPDAFELIRAYGNKLQALPNEFQLIMSNLPTGYHRDKQVLKESFIPAFELLEQMVDITTLLLQNIRVNNEILKDPKYNYLFTVEYVNRLVADGVPFRDAYRIVAEEIAQGKYAPGKQGKYTHTGSIGNPGNEGIREKLKRIYSRIDPEHVRKALLQLVSDDI